MHASAGARVLANLPHVLSFGRVLTVGAAHGAALTGNLPLFATLVLVAVLTDILDGPVARAYGTESRFGANLDTAADMLFNLSLPVWTWQFRPEVVMDHAIVIGVFVALYLVANLSLHRLFGALGVHNRLSRTSSTGGVFFALYIILFGFSTPLYVALMVLLATDLAQRYRAIVGALLAKRAPSRGNS